MDDRYQQCKDAGICVRCRRNEADGTIYCSECRVKRVEASRRDTKSGYYNERNARLKLEAIEAYGGQCQCCGESNPKFLTLDHINSDGAEHRRNDGGNIWNYVKRNNYPSDLQLLCWNCNCGRYYNGGVCPHDDD